MYKVLVFAIALLLTACVRPESPKSDLADMHDLALEISRICYERRLAGELSGKAESVRCSRPMIIALYRRHHYPHLDLYEILAAQDLAVSEREDRGEITEAQGLAERKANLDRMEAEIRRREADAAGNQPQIHKPSRDRPSTRA
jgi:hypothetical protein